MRKIVKTSLISLLSVFAIGVTAYGVNGTTKTADAATTETVKVTGDFVMKTGGAVRKESPTGIRFSTYVKESVYDETYTYGTLIYPAELLGDNALTIETVDVRNIETDIWAESDAEGYKLYHSVLTEIPAEFYGTKLVARSYVLSNGTYTYVDNAQTRSIAQVAASALANGEKDSADNLLVNYVDKTVTSFSLNTTEKQSLKAGDTFTLVAQVEPADYEVAWKTSNASVAQVKDGVVTAVGAGTATITASLGSKSFSCEVEVGARQFNNVGAISINEATGALTWDKVSATDNAEFYADKYEVTITDENGNVTTYNVFDNEYRPYTLAAGTYTASVKAAHSMGYVASSAVASETYKFVVARYADYLAADMTEQFESNENGTYVEYNEESGYATIKNRNEFGLVVSKNGISLNMELNPIIIMDTVAGNGYRYFKASYNGSKNLPKNDNGKIKLVNDTDMGTYEEDRYYAIQIKETVESGTLTGEVEDFKIYPGLCKGSNSWVSLRGIYILSVSEYVEAEAEQLETLSNMKMSNGVVSTDKLVSAYPNVEITYTATVTGVDANYTFENLKEPTIDLTSLDLAAGKVYTVSMIANGDGVYYTDSEAISKEVVYNEVYNVSDFTGASITSRHADNCVRVGDNGEFIVEVNGTYTLYSLNINMEGKRLTANSMVKTTFGEVKENTKFWTGFFKSKNTEGDRDHVFEGKVDSYSSFTSKDFYKNSGSYIIDDVFYYGFGIGGSGGRLTITNITIAEYAFYPCEATTTTESLTFDKSNGTDQTIAYKFANGGTLASVAIDGKKVDYTDNYDSVTINAGEFADLAYGAHTVTVMDNNGYSVDVVLTVMNSKSVSFESGSVTWLTDENATAYEVKILDTDYQATVNGNSYTIAEKNLPTDTYTVEVTSVYEDGSKALWGSINLNVEQLVYKSGKIYNSSYKEGEGDKTEEGARAEYRESEGVTRVIAAGKEWGCVYTDDLKVNGENLQFSENSYLTFTMGTITNGYYVRLVRDGHEKWAKEVKQATDSATVIVSAKKLNVEYNRATYYIKLGSSGQQGGYVDYISYSVCNITVAN